MQIVAHTNHCRERDWGKASLQRVATPVVKEHGTMGTGVCVMEGCGDRSWKAMGYVTDVGWRTGGERSYDGGRIKCDKSDTDKIKYVAYASGPKKKFFLLILLWFVSCTMD